MNVARFKDGQLIHIDGVLDSEIYENRDIAYHADVIYSDGRKYKMNDARSIEKMPIPNFAVDGGMFYNTTGSLDYILRMVAGKIRETNHPLSILCLKKAVQMMEKSPILWQYKDYWRLCEWLYQDGFEKEADELDAYFYKRYLIAPSQPKDEEYRKDRRLYYISLNRVPERVPKSFAAFRRLKTTNPEEYALLVQMFSVNTIGEKTYKSDDSAERELLPHAVKLVLDSNQPSISMLQRSLGVGYATAAKMIDTMEQRGIVSSFDGTKPRRVLIGKAEYEKMFGKTP